MNGDSIKLLVQLQRIAEGYLDENKASELQWSEFKLDLMGIVYATDREFHRKVLKEVRAREGKDK